MLLTYVDNYEFASFLDFANDKRFFKVAVDVLQDTNLFTDTPRKEIEEMVRKRSDVLNPRLNVRTEEDEYNWMGTSNWDYRWMEETLLRMDDAFTIEENMSCGFTIYQYKVTKR